MISSTTRTAGPYAGNGLQTAFPFAFKVFQASDLLVVQVDSLGNTTTLTLTSQYAVTLNANQDSAPGGTVNLVTALPVGYTLTSSSQVKALQNTNLTNAGNFYPTTLNNSLDYLTILIQQLQVALNNCLQVSIGSGNVSLLLPNPSPLALLGWDSSGTEIINTTATGLAATLASEPAYTQIFNGTGSQTTFLLASNPGSNANTDVYVSGVRQLPGIDYNVVGLNVVFTIAPPTGTNNILVVWNTALGATGIAAAAAAAVATATAAAAASQTAAAASATAAALSATSAASSLTSFKDLYYGPLSTDPTTRPDNTAMQAGDLYWSTSAIKMRVYNGTNWQSFAPSAPSAQLFSGTGSQTVFTLSTSPTSAASLVISIGGIAQRSTTDFTVSGTTLTFVTAPPAGTNNINVVNFG